MHSVRQLRYVLARQMRDHVIGIARGVLRQVADVDHVGWLKGPDQRLNPRYDCHETDPSHEVDGIGLGMLARNGDSSGKTENEDCKYQEPNHDHEDRQEGHVVPKPHLITFVLVATSYSLGCPIALLSLISCMTWSKL